jgi:hypothetical protein
MFSDQSSLYTCMKNSTLKTAKEKRKGRG